MMNGFQCCEVASICRGLKDDTNSSSELTSTRAFKLRVKIQYSDFAWIATPKTPKDLHSGGLSRPIRTQHGKDLPLFDGKVSSIDGYTRALTLMKVANFNDAHPFILPP
jgi:hypothetical protein